MNGQFDDADVGNLASGYSCDTGLTNGSQKQNSISGNPHCEYEYEGSTWSTEEEHVVVPPNAFAAHSDYCDANGNAWNEFDGCEDFDGLQRGGNITKRYLNNAANRVQPNSQPSGKFKQAKPMINIGKVASKRKDKRDHATVEQVMDEATRKTLFKMQSQGIIKSINGCISTGKEANVYHATSNYGDRAIKVYKTSIIVFKNRGQYVEGDRRFNRHGNSNQQMVAIWAEKELRNLKRIHRAGIRCPEPVLLKNNVLVMEFIGKAQDGQTIAEHALRLKDSKLRESQYHKFYLDCIRMMRTLYQECQLVHADLSEFNMLVHEGELVVIDVSQSVENDHANAFPFLIIDCTNVTHFFLNQGVSTMTTMELFDFVTDVNITSENRDEYLEKVQEMCSVRTREDVREKERLEEPVLKRLYIPRTLNDVPNFERDCKRMQSNTDTDLVMYQNIIGLRTDLTGASCTPKLLEGQENDESDEEDENDENEQNQDEDTKNEKVEGELKRNDKTATRDNKETKESKKARKRSTKEAQRERRVDKKKTKDSWKNKAGSKK